MADKTTSNIGFEKQIWDAACVLRGNIDASEYKSVVLGLIFLKYISDRFEAKYRELVDEGDGFEEDIDEYISENIFFVPENARWGVIASSAHTPEIGTVIDEAMRSIEKENKRLKDMQNYLSERTDANPALFVSLKAPHDRLMIGGVETRLRDLGKRLSLTKVHPHKFRRTLATSAIDKGMPIEQVQQLLGHQKIDTTMHYAMVKQQNVKLAHRKYIG